MICTRVAGTRGWGSRAVGSAGPLCAGARRHLTPRVIDRTGVGALRFEPSEVATARTPARTTPTGRVVSLADARDDRRLREHLERLRHVQATNRKALSRLFQSGVIFTRAGSRLGRDLLLAHQHLLKAADLLARLGDIAAGGRGRRDAEAEALYAQVQALLARTSELSARSDGLLAR